MKKNQGPWLHRFLVSVFTIILAILIFWLLGFIVKDIQSIPGPNYNDIEKSFLDAELIKKQDKLNSEIASVNRKIHIKEEEMRIVSDSSQNLQKTINQLIGLQKLAVQNSVPFSEKEQSNLSESLSHFLKSQQTYQTHNSELAKLTNQKRKIEEEKEKLENIIEQKRKPARKKFRMLQERHDIYLASLQLLVLIPLLIAGAFLCVKKRDSIYFPLFLGCGSAILVKVFLVIHKYFPSRYFKYLLISGLIIVVAKLLIHLIRTVAFPKPQWLTKQHREAYQHFLCPICEYPIKTGPRKFLSWTRRNANKILPLNDSSKEEPYSCPSCGTKLFEECPQCNKIRHSLLPFCQHCNNEKKSIHK